MAHHHAAVVLGAELAEDRVGLAHVRRGLEQLFVRRAHVAGAGRADRDHVVETERFGLRVGAGVEDARDVAVRVVEDRGAAARGGGELDQLDAELLGEEHRRGEELLARFFGDAAREEAVLAHLRRLGVALRSPALQAVAVMRDTGASRVSKIVLISSTFGTGLRNIGGIFPAIASRRPNGATLIRPLMLKRPTVP